MFVHPCIVVVVADERTRQGVVVAIHACSWYHLTRIAVFDLNVGEVWKETQELILGKPVTFMHGMIQPVIILKPVASTRGVVQCG